MSNLAIKENVTVAGAIVPNISGGFGEGKKAMLAKHIAEIHEKKLIHVNEVINDNRIRFKDNVDIIDVKNDSDFVIALTDNNIFTNMQVGKAKNIYLLSERGYAKLIKIFNDDKSWDLYDQLLDEYFDLRDSNVVQMNQQPSTQLEVLQSIVNGMVESERKMNEVSDKVIQIETKLNNNTVEDGYKTSHNIARELGLYSNNDKPHGMFIDAVAKTLKIYNKKLGYKDEYVNAVQDVTHGGQSSVVVYYSEKSKGLIEKFLADNFKLDVIHFIRGSKKGEVNKIKYELGRSYEFNNSTYVKYTK